MKRLMLSLAVAGLVVGSARAGEPEWLTDLGKAQALAKEQNKRVLVNFTGSDWCGFCIRLKKDVFSTKEFTEYAAKNLVLVEIDFPRKKQLPAEQKKANDKLQAQYHVDGFPTIVILDANGKTLGREVGYEGKGATDYIARLEKHKG